MASILGASSRDSISAYSQGMESAANTSSFQDLDQREVLDTLVDRVESTDTKNFIAEFGEGGAHAAFDLSVPLAKDVFKRDKPTGLGTRWINIWCPSKQTQFLELLAKHYDFSPRMLGLMSSDPRRSRSPPISNKSQHHRLNRFWSRRSVDSSTDLGIEKGADELSEQLSIASHDSAHGGNLYRIVEEIWHYSSIDLGRNYICLGYNTLYGTKPCVVPENPLPQCIRVWTWLLLCEDNTVITINEDPFPNVASHLNAIQQRIHSETRRNLLNVFRSLSLIDSDPLRSRNPMTLLPLRTRLGSTPEETAHRPTDTPGLLFYYLFENWHNSYTLITRKESRYGTELAQLRAEMLQSPQLTHIDRLDRIGTELGVLKKHYEGYRRLIERVLEPIPVTDASLQNSQVTHSDSGSPASSLHTIRPLMTEKESTLGVSLSSTARARFARLRDLIDLYALSEVEDYLKQKESLISLNFSLLTLKESLDVERLTRITLLLTKATILFLPVSLMTAYFSVPLQPVAGDDGGGWTIPQYWISFAVTFALSFLALVVFGVFSGSVQMVEVWRGFVGGMKRVGRDVRGLVG